MEIQIGFEGNTNHRGCFPDDSGRWKAHDLDPFLSNWMKLRMCRTGGSLYLTQYYSADVDPVERIKDKIFCLVKLCPNSGIDWANLIRMANDVINHFGNADRTSNVCTANVRDKQVGIQTESIFNIPNMDEHGLFDEAMLMGEGSIGDMGNNSMSFGSPSGNELNHTERITYDGPDYGVTGAAASNKTPRLFGPVKLEQIQINGNDGMMTKNLRVLQEADAEIQTEVTGQKKTQSLKTDIETRMAEKFTNMKKVRTYSSSC